MRVNEHRLSESFGSREGPGLRLMVSNESLASKLDGLANTPTATDLGYEDSEVCTTLSAQGSVEFTPAESTEPSEAWLRSDTGSFVFTLETWR